jgi:ABC-type dipeptide/oligopeptide/nickel transport system permease component
MFKPGLIKYIVRRLLISVPVVVAASFLCFALTTAMGDPLGEWKLQKPRTQSEIAAAEHRAGLDKPFLERYGIWAKNFVKGDWGTTVTPGNSTQDVRKKVTKASWVSIRLLLVAEIIALLIGVLLGVMSAVRQYSLFDYVATGAAFVMFSMPTFCLAVMVKVLTIDFNDFLQQLGLARWLRTAGPPNGGFHGSFTDQLYQYSGAYLLPTLCLVAIQFAGYSRFQRASMLESMHSDYVRTATAKGLSQARVLYRHALRTALIPITTLSAFSFGSVIAGALITETIFAWQGMGALLVDAVNKKEPYMLLGILVVTAVSTIIFNLIADIMYAVLDPRIRL